MKYNSCTEDLPCGFEDGAAIFAELRTELSLSLNNIEMPPRKSVSILGRLLNYSNDNEFNGEIGSTNDFLIILLAVKYFLKMLFSLTGIKNSL